MCTLQSGELGCVTRENKEVDVLKAGACFGELAALGLTPERALTLTAKSTTVVYRVAAKDFEESFSDQPEAYAKLLGTMKKSALQKYHDNLFVVSHLRRIFKAEGPLILPMFTKHSLRQFLTIEDRDTVLGILAKVKKSEGALHCVTVHLLRCQTGE